MSVFGDMLLSYFGGYRSEKILSVNLEELIQAQGHSPEGEVKLRALWPEKIRKAREYDEIARENAREAGRELLRTEIAKPSLLSMIKKDDSWKGGSLIVPFGSEK